MDTYKLKILVVFYQLDSMNLIHVCNILSDKADLMLSHNVFLEIIWHIYFVSMKTIHDFTLISIMFINYAFSFSLLYQYKMSIQ